MEERTKYIHYGHNSFDKNLFVAPSNREFFVKPFGGLWASPVDAKWGWKDWCKSENFNLNRLDDSFTFTLKDGATVAHIFDVGYLERLPRLGSMFSLWVCLDFEKLLADGCDAVELHLSEDRSMGDSLYWKLYGWDCDSIVILNPDVVVVEE